MKKMLSLAVLVMVTLVAVVTFSRTAHADDVKIVGTVSRIEMAADNKSAVVVLKDSKSGEEVSIIVNDELTLDKFMDKRIVEGAEIRCKYEKTDGKNVSKMFKKTAGC